MGEAEGKVSLVVVGPGVVGTEFHAALGVEERMVRPPGPLWMDADGLPAGRWRP